MSCENKPESNGPQYLAIMALALVLTCAIASYTVIELSKSGMFLSRPSTTEAIK